MSWASGAKAARPRLEQALLQLREGDALATWKLGRLGGLPPRLLPTGKYLETRGIGFRPLRESIDTITAGGELGFHVFSALAEFKRDLIRERAGGRTRDDSPSHTQTLQEIRRRDLASWSDCLRGSRSRMGLCLPCRARG